MTIEITLHVDAHGYFSASSTWGQSAWHRDVMVALSELLSQAVLKIIVSLASEDSPSVAPLKDETKTSGRD